MRAIALAACMCSAPLVSGAQTISGNDVYRACTADDQGAMDGFCTGYVIGVLEGIKWGVATTFALISEEAVPVERLNAFIEQSLNVCAPSDVTYHQYRDVVVQYLAAHPATRHLSARTQALEAFQEAFPCD